jgi:hypothetical protein
MNLLQRQIGNDHSTGPSKSKSLNPVTLVKSEEFAFPVCQKSGSFGQWSETELYFFSPARMGTLSVFSAGGTGQLNVLL